MEREKMTQESYFKILDSEVILKLPYRGPTTKRIYIVISENDKELTKEIFVQRRDAFTIDLISSLNRLKNHEISEIRYKCGLGGFIRIYLGEKRKLAGEYFTNSKQEWENFQRRLGLST
jgi:hypothetical protein